MRCSGSCAARPPLSPPCTHLEELLQHFDGCWHQLLLNHTRIPAAHTLQLVHSTNTQLTGTNTTTAAAAAAAGWFAASTATGRLLLLLLLLCIISSQLLQASAQDLLLLLGHRAVLATTCRGTTMQDTTSGHKVVHLRTRLTMDAE